MYGSKSNLPESHLGLKSDKSIADQQAPGGIDSEKDERVAKAPHSPGFFAGTSTVIFWAAKIESPVVSSAWKRELQAGLFGV